MQRSDWIGRLLCGAGIFGLGWLHAYFFGNPEGTRAGVAVYVCTAALANAIDIVLSAGLMRGKASYDMQRLAYCAIVVNFLSFIAFTAKNSPLVSALNMAITVISYAQLVRLLWPGNGNLSPHPWRFGFLRFTALQSPRIHLEKKK